MSKGNKGEIMSSKISSFERGWVSALSPRTPPAMPLKSLAAAVSTVLGMTCSMPAVSATQMTPDGRTQTTIAQAGNTYDVTTATLSRNGKTAFNSFHDFSVDAGDTVQMHLPEGTGSLVNLVWDSRAAINGTLKSMLSNGDTGGAVYFADPHGVVIGNGAEVDVGALSLSAPTQDFMSSLLGEDGSLSTDTDQGPLLMLMQGTEPQAPAPADGSCLICVAGRVDASNAVRVRATAIDVSGTIFVSGRGDDTLSTAVNVEDQADPVIVADGNTIRLIADASDSTGYGDAGANASIHVDGLLHTAGASAPDSADPASWGLVQVDAHAAAQAAFTTQEAGSDTSALVTQQVQDLFKDQNDLFEKGLNDAAIDANVAAADRLGQAAFVRASATATVDITGTIEAGGDALLSAATTTEASTDATAKADKKAAPVMVGAMYGAVYSKAKVNVADSASVVAGGALAVNANTDNTLDVSADTEVGDRPVATTVAWSQAAVEASSVVAGHVQGQSLAITAHNANSFSTVASTGARASGGSVGIAGAVSLQTVHAEAQLGGTPAIVAGGSGNVTVAAGNDTAANVTTALTSDLSAEDSEQSEDKSDTANADLTGTLANKSNAGLNADGSQDRDALPFHVGSAIAYTDAHHTASASIADGVKLITPGDIAVYSEVTDAGVHNGASSRTISVTGSNGEDGAQKVTIAAAVAYAQYQHDSSATIGTNADITAAHIGVGSDVSMPFDWSFGQSDNADVFNHMFDSLDDFIAGAAALKELGGGREAIMGGVTGYAGATAGGQSAAAIGGSVNYLAVSHSNRAWIGDGAHLTSTANASATPGDDGWSSAIDWSDAAIDWDHSIAVAAHTETTAFDLVGDMMLGLDGTAVGGAFNYTGYRNDNVAGVGSGAVLASANDVGIGAVSDDRLIALSPVSGKGGSTGMQGTVAITDLDDATHASVSAAANVAARALRVQADNPLMVWSLAGALGLSNQASVGIAVGINQTRTDTLASIGDNSADDPTIASGTTPTQTDGTVRVSTLSVLAATRGESGALSVAGTSTGSSSNGGGNGDGDSDPGSDGTRSTKLLQMVGKAKTVTGHLQEAVEKVDSMAGVLGDGGSLLDDAGDALDQIAGGLDDAQSAGKGLRGLTGKAGEEGGEHQGTQPDSTTRNKGGSFGIGVSGAAAVNLAQLGARAELDGAHVVGTGDDASVTVRATDEASLASFAGAAALQRAKTSGFSGAIAGAVAYSSVADTTTARIHDSRLDAAPQVAVQALDGSQQIGVAIGMGVNSSGSTAVTIAGSVSLATSRNTTLAAIDGGSVLDGGGSDGSQLDVTAYDHSRIGVGGGSLYAGTGGSAGANVGIGFTYADIGNSTLAELSGHNETTGDDIAGYDTLSLRALDSTLIGAGALAGGYAGSQDSLSLAGAIVWTNIANTTQADIDQGMQLRIGSNALVQASAVAPVDALDALLDTPDAAGYDFTGTQLGSSDALTGGQAPGSAGDPDQPTLSLDSGGLGSSIIAVAGTLQAGGNNVGLSYVGNNVHNTHSVRIDDATLDVGDTLSLAARDDTRIIGVAAGLGVSSGQFAGLGSATSNIVGNTDSILIGSAATPGHGATVLAGTVDALASDDTTIYALAGNIAIGKGSLAAGGALTYNAIANNVSTHAGNTVFDVDGTVGLHAAESATILAGAVAATASGQGTTLTLSLGWNQTADNLQSVLDDGSLLHAGALDLTATNGADIYTLSGGISIGGSAAAGLAVSIGDIGDTTTASMEDVGLDVAATGNADGAVQVAANGTGSLYSLAVAGAAGSSGAGIAGSVTVNTLDSDVAARVSHIFGVSDDLGAATDTAAKADSLLVQANNSGGIYTLAGGVAFGSSAGVGAAVAVADVGGTTSAHLGDAVLDVGGDTTVAAGSSTTIDSASVAGAAAGSVAVSASNTTNLVHNGISADMVNVGTTDSIEDTSQHNVTRVQASNDATINALAGAVGGAGSAAVGAATSVNRIATTTSAAFDGGSDEEGNDNRLYKTGSLLVSAGAGNPNADGEGNASNINTIAVGAAGGGSAAVAGSIAVNILQGSTTAGIGHGAHVIANDNLGVLAGNDQGIDVFAGQAALGGSVGVGLGVVVNDIDSSTVATIADSDVTAFGLGDALDVDDGDAAHTDALDSSIDVTGSDDLADSIAKPKDYARPDLAGTVTEVHGVAVNASNQQHIATLGVGASIGGAAAVGALAGVNVVGGTTSASIENARVNQTALPTATTANILSEGDDSNGSADDGHDGTASGDTAVQQVDVRAGSRQYEANFVVNLVGAGTAGAAVSAAANVFDATTSAQISGSTVSSQAGTAIDATGQQWSLAMAAGAAASGEVAAAASGAVTVMQANTSATLDGGSLDVGSLDVTAASHAASSQIAGAVGIGIGAAGVAGAAAVNVDNTTTTASIQNGANVRAGNAVNVDATSSNVAKALVVGGAAGFGAGMAGGALVNVAENHTQAFVENSRVDAGNIGIAALDQQIIRANSGTLGAGLVGVGGAINVSLLQSSVGSGAVDSTLITHGGDIAVTADSQRDLQSKALAFGAGAVGAGLSASVIVAGTGNLGDNADDLHSSGQINLDQLDALSSQDRLNGDNASYGLDDDQLGDAELASLNDHARYSLTDATEGANGSFGNSDGVRAQISGGSLSSAGQVIVSADVSTATDNVAGGVAAGVAAMGGSLAYTSLSTDVHASIDSGTAVTAANGIDVSASSGDLGGGIAASSQAYAGVGGLVGVGAAVAVSHVDNTVSASAGGNLLAQDAGTGTLTIGAADSSSAVAGNGNLKDINNISFGGIVAGAVVVDAQRSSSVSALLDDQTVASSFAGVDVGASDSGQVQANGIMGAGGVLSAVSAVVASASDNSAVVAGIGRGARVSAATTSVHASADPTASAEAKGITIGGIGGGIGANVALASVGASVDAYVDDGAMFDTGNLSVAASASPQVIAGSSGGAGAALLGVNASVAEASDTVAVNAWIGDAVKLPSGNVSIAAATHTQQSATALGVSGGIVAMGAAVAKATSHATTNATLGDGDGSTATTAGTLAVIASGTDVNDAHSKAGSGGLVAGTAAEADTASNSSANASIGAHQQLKNLASLQLSAIENISYGGIADSVQAAAVGGSGAFVNNRIDSSTDAHIGDGTTIVAGGDIDVLAQTRLGNTLHNDGATGGAGGILNGTAAKVQTRIDARNTAAIGTDATIISGQAPSASHVGHTTILAGTMASALGDTATISAGGVVPAANAAVDIADNFVNQVQLGDRGNYLSFGRTDIGTYTSLQQVSALATSDTYGLAPIGSSSANVSLNSTQAVDIGDDVGITGYDEVDVVAGKDILNGRETQLAASAFAQSYVRGIASIPAADAAVTTASTSNLVLGAGSLVVSGGDIAIGAQQGTHPISVDGTGYGYQLGFIPSTTHSSTQSSTDTATTMLDGSVIAGAFNSIDLSIDTDGNLHDAGSTAPYLATLKKDFNPTEYLNQLDGVTGRTYSGMDDAAVGGYIFGSLLVAGGDAYLYGSTIGGTGAVTANGTPSVNIRNDSSYYLVLPDIEVGFGSAGHVRVSGGADAAHLGGLTVTQSADSGASPTVTITSTHTLTPTGTAPGIVLGSVTNLDGTVTIKNDYGSLLQRGSVSANTQTVYVPGGYVTIDLGNGNWYSGADPASDLDSSWIGQFIDGVIGSPDYAAAAIALSVYPGVADNPTIPGPPPNFTTPSNYQQSVLVLYGSCAPYVGTGSLDGCGGSVPGGSQYSLLGRPLALAPHIALQQTGKFAGTQQTSSSSFTGQNFSVKAQYIDIDGVINAGSAASWTVQTTDALKDWIATTDQAYANGRISDPNIRLTVSANGGTTSLTDASGRPLLQLAGDQASQLIGAVYNAATHQLVLDNVTANGGGSVTLDGKIVSTAQGSIHVNSGYGSVQVDNTSGVPLVLQNVYAGKGGTGIIAITDRLQPWADGTEKTTWYVSENGQAAQQYDNRNGATDWQQAYQVGAVGDDATYAPKAGTEFQWAATTHVMRSYDKTSGDHNWSLGKWQWATDSGATAGQHWTLGASKFIDGPGQDGYVDLAGNDYQLSLSGTIDWGYYVNVAYHGCHNDHCNFGTHQTGQDSQGNDASLWRYFYPTTGTLTLTATQRADLPIGIHFSTSGTNAVDIQSNSDILLNGQVNNSGGATTLSATDGGSIVQGTDSALLWTHSLDMSAAGDIGSGHAPVQVRITHQDGVADGYLQARTTGGDIDIDVDSGSRALAFGAVAGDGADYGDVTIRNTGSLVGIDGAPVDVVGRDINLTSTQGSVGSIADPLTIELHPGSLYNGAAAGGVLDVQASGDIGIDNRHGDLRVGQVASEHGDVALTASQGGIYDASGQDAASTLSQDQARAIWDKLHLTDGTAADSMVTAIESSVNASYAQYWQLRDVGSVASDGHYVLNADAVALYWPLAAAADGIDPASVTDPAEQARLTQAYASTRYDGVVDAFATYLGDGWATTAAFDGRTQADPAFHFVLDKNSATYAALTSGSQWTDGQLEHAINGATLAAAGGSQVGPAVPNVSGANVTLNANAGGVGSNDAPLTIDYDELKNLYEGKPSTLTDAQILALGQANAAGDVVLLDAAGNVLSVNDPNLQSRLATLSIRQTSPLYVAATGKVAGSATGSLYLQANGDLTIDRLQSGTDMRLTATGNIQAADTGDHDRTEIVTGGDLLLNAGGGHIAFGNGNGTDAGDALVVDIGGALVGASASTDLLLRQADGDLRVGTAFGNGLVSLEASQGSLLGLTGGLSVSGHDVALTARDDIGRRTATASGVNAPLQVQMAATGHLDADAGGAVSLEVAQNDFHIGTIQSGGDLVLTADSGALDAQHLISTGGAVRVTAGTTGQVGDVQAAGDVALAAATTLTAGTVTSTDGDIALTAANGMSLQKLTATGGSIHATLVGTGSPALRIGAAGRLTAANAIDLHTGGDLLMGRSSLIQANGAIDLDAGGDIVLGRIDGLAATGTAIGLQAGGAILGNGDALNLQARAGGTTVLRAADGIGDVARPLALDVDRLDATSDQGDIRIHALGDLAIAQLLADNGTAQVSVDGLLQYDLLRAGLDATVSAGRIDGDVLTVGRQASIHADGEGTLHTLGIGGDLAMDTGGDLTAGTLTVGGQTTLHAGGTLDLTSLDGGDAATLDSGEAMTLGDIVLGHGDLHADTGADLALSGHANVQQGNAALTSGTTMTLAALHAAGALDARAGRDFAADTLTVGGKTHLQAVGALDLTTLAGGDAATLSSGGAMRLGDVVLATGDLQADAGNDLAVTGHADVQQGKAALTSQAAMTLAALHAATTFGAEAGAGLSAAELDVGGDAELSAGGTTHVQSATIGGDLTIDAGGDLAIETLAVGGKTALQADGWLGLTALAGNDAATLKSGDAMTLGDIVLTDGDLQADAGADLALTSHAEVQQGGASLQAAGAMHLDGSLSSGGDVSMVADGPLQFTSVDAKGHVFGQSQTGDIGGNVADADDWLKFLAGTDLRVGTLQADGDTTLQAGNDVAIDKTTAGGDIAVTAGGDVAMTTTQAGKNASIDAGGKLDVGQVQMAGTLDAKSGTDLTAGTLAIGSSSTIHAGQALQLTSLTGGGAAALDAGDAMTLGDVVLSDGDLQADAGADLALTGHAEVRQGGATLQAAGAMRLDGPLSSGGDVSMVANGPLQLTSIDAKGNVFGQSQTGDISGNTVDADDWLKFLAGTDLRVGTLQVGGDTTLQVGNDVTVDKTTAGGDLAVTAGGDVAMTTTQAGKNASIDAGGKLDVGQVQTAGTLDAEAGTDLTAATLAIGSASTIHAGRGLQLTTLAGGGAATLHAGDAMTLGDVVLTDGDLQADAGADLAVTGHAEVQQGGVTLQAAGAMHLGGPLSSGGDVSMVANGPLQFTSVDAKGHVFGQSQTGDIDGSTVDADDWLKFLAGTNLHADTLQAGSDTTLQAGNDVTVNGTTAGGNIAVAAGGNVAMTTTQAGKNASIDAGGKLGIGRMQTGSLFDATAGTDLTAATLKIGGASTLHAGHVLQLTTLTGGGQAKLDAGDAMTLGDVVLTAGDLRADAGANLVLTGHADVQRGNAALTSKATMTLAALHAAGTLDAKADADLSAGTLDVAGRTGLASGGSTQLQRATVGGDLTATAGTDFTADTLAIGGKTTVQASRAMNLSSLTGGNTATLDSGNAMTLGDVVLTAGDLQADAGADLLLRNHGDVRQGDATLQAAGAMRLDGPLSGGDVSMVAGGPLQFTSLDARGHAFGQSQQGDIVGNSIAANDWLKLLASANLHVDTLQAAADATLQAGGNVATSTVTAGGNIAATGGGDVAMTTTQAGKNATIAAGRRLDIGHMQAGSVLDAKAASDLSAGTVQVGGTSLLHAGHVLQLTTLTGGDQATLDSGDAMTLGDIVLTAGDLRADAGNAMALTGHADVQQGNAALTSKASMTLAALHAAGTLDAKAATDLSATTLGVGSRANLAADGAMQLQHATIGGDLAAAAGGNLTANTLAIGGKTALQAGNTLALIQLAGGHAATLRSGKAMTLGDLVLATGDLQADAGASMGLTGHADVQQGDATLTSTASMTLAALHASGALHAKSSADLAAGTLNVGGDSDLTAQGAMQIKRATVGADLAASAGHDLAADTLAVGGKTALQADGELDLTTLSGGNNATLNAGAAMTLGGLVLTGGTLQTDAGADLTLSGHADVKQGDATLHAARTMHLAGPLSGGGKVSMVAGGPLQFTSVTAGGQALGQSLAGDITGNTLSAGDSLQLLSAAAIRVGTLQAATDATLQAKGAVTTDKVAAGRDMIVSAGGDVGMATTQAGRNVSIDAGGKLDVTGMQAGATLGLTAQHMRFDQLSAVTSAKLLSRNGDITGASLTTRDADVAASGAIQLDAAAIGSSINLAADTIQASIRQTGDDPSLHSVLTGFEGGTAQRVAVDVNAPKQWMIDRLSAVNAALATLAPSVRIKDGHSEQTMDLTTSLAKLWMNQGSASLQPADVQLIQPNHDFQLYQDGIHTLSDAFVVRYAYGYEVDIPNYVATRDWEVPYYPGESALRFNSRTLVDHTDDVDRGDGKSKRTRPAAKPHERALVQPAPGSGEIAVNLSAPN